MTVTPPLLSADVVSPAGYAVKLSVFEGPLDLLLHLIRINEVEISDIPVALIAEQYVDYLGPMRDLNLDVVGEYLVMAATLAWIKSRMLLPPDADGEDEENDPRAELVARLLEYKRYKEVAGKLGERPLLGRDVYATSGEEIERPEDGEREIEVGLFELVDAFRSVLKAGRDKVAAPHEIEVEAVTVRERMLAVMSVLEEREAIEFHRIFEVFDRVRVSRTVLVATFLAILELVRVSAIRVYQGLDAVGAPEGPIHVRRGEADDGWSARISELM